MIVSPSILSMDFMNLKGQLEILNEEVKWLHYDVIDGSFAPMITVGPALLKTFRKNSPLVLDVHLMINNPEKYVDEFIDAGADSITFHYENYNDIAKCNDLIEKIKNRNCKAAIAISPDTPVCAINPLLTKVDMVLVMAVKPGYRDSYMEKAINKISKLAQLRKENTYSYLIQVDGGVNANNLKAILEAGCDSFVAGGFTFNGDIRENLATMREIEKSVKSEIKEHFI